MENRTAKKLFGSKHNLTREKLQEAIELNEHMPNELAQMVVQSDFEMAAFDGYQENKSSIYELHRLDNQLFKLLDTQRKPRINDNKIIIIWLIVIFCILGIGLILNEKNTDLNKATNRSRISFSKSVVGTKKKEDSSYKIDQVEIRERFIKDTYLTIKTEKGSKLRNSLFLDNSRAMEAPNKLNLIAATQLDAINSNLFVKKPIVKEIMLSDHIFVDYRTLRSYEENKIHPFKGLRANLNSSEAKIELDEPNSLEQTIGYHQYLTETAIFLKAKNWGMAEERFKVILKHYPNDLNALFYLGFTAHNVGECKESIKFLDQIEQSYYGNFDQEAAWYKFKCTLEQKNYDLARKQVQSIIERNGFYKEQAQEALKALENSRLLEP